LVSHLNFLTGVPSNFLEEELDMGRQACLPSEGLYRQEVHENLSDLWGA
jgi:hypothetical protein